MARRSAGRQTAAGRGVVVTAVVGALLAITTATASAASPPVAFAPHVDYDLDASSQSVASGDLDGDAHADLVTVGPDRDQVSVLFGLGDGTFAPPVTFGTGPVPSSVAIGDLDGDVDLDLVVTNIGRSFDFDDSSVSVLLNHGDGTFAPDTVIPVHLGPVEVDIVDVNRDDDADLVITHNGYLAIGLDAGRVSVMLGNGAGSFTIASTQLFESQQPYLGSAVGEVTGDAHPDIVVVQRLDEPARLWVLAGNGDGTFAPPVLYDDAPQPGPFNQTASAVAIGDLDGDGANEVVVSYCCTQTSAYLAVLEVAADGTVSEASAFPLSTQITPHAVTLGDLNDDGHLDAAVAFDQEAVEILLGNGDETFDAATRISTPDTWSTAVALADLDDDDRLDIVTGHGELFAVSVLLNTTVPVVPAAPTIGAAVAGASSTTVSWIAPTADGGSEVTGYVVTPYIGYFPLPSRSFGSTATTQVVTGLANGTTYRFRVQAVNAVGVGMFSKVTNPVTPAAPTAPGAPTIGTGTPGNGEATVTWTAPAADGGSAVTGYVVTPYIGYYPLPSQTFASTATSQVVTGLTNGTQYRFRVQAINAIGTGGYSKVSNPVIPTA